MVVEIICIYLCRRSHNPASPHCRWNSLSAAMLKRHLSDVDSWRYQLDANVGGSGHLRRVLIGPVCGRLHGYFWLHYYAFHLHVYQIGIIAGWRWRRFIRCCRYTAFLGIAVFVVTTVNSISIFRVIRIVDAVAAANIQHIIVHRTGRGDWCTRRFPRLRFFSDSG